MVPQEKIGRLNPPAIMRSIVSTLLDLVKTHKSGNPAPDHRSFTAMRTGFGQGWCEISGSVPCVFIAGFVRVRRYQREAFSVEGSVNLFEQTMQVLEWPRLLDALAGHARSA